MEKRSVKGNCKIFCAVATSAVKGTRLWESKAKSTWNGYKRERIKPVHFKPYLML